MRNEGDGLLEGVAEAIAEGKMADVVVFDKATLSDRSTLESPHPLSVGVRWLAVSAGGAKVP